MGRREEKYEILRERDYKKPNEMINGRGAGTAMSQKLFAIGMEHISLDDTNHVVTEITESEIRKLLNTKSKDLYHQIEKLVDKENADDHATIFDWGLLIKNEDANEIEAHQVVTDAVFKNGKLTLRYNDYFTERIIAKKNYTTLPLKDILNLSSRYSCKFYENLTSAYNRQRALDEKRGVAKNEYAFYFHLLELKFTLGIVKTHGNKTIREELNKEEPNYELIEKILDENDWNKYKEYKTFNKQVIKVMVNEINQKTVLNVDTEPKKQGRNTIGVFFFVSKKNSIKQEDDGTKTLLTKEAKDILLDELVSELIGTYKYTEIMDICEYANYNKAKILKGYEFVKSYTGEIDSPVALIKWAIFNDAEPNKSQKKSGFTNFEQNTIDFAELEEKLLDN